MAYQIIGGIPVPTGNTPTYPKMGGSNITKTQPGYNYATGGTYVPQKATGGTSTPKPPSPISEVVQALVEYQSPKTSTPSAPGYNFPQFNIGIPDLSWNPTETMRGTWLEEAMKRAALQIDPQVAAREQGLNRFRRAAEANRTEINPRYDRMSSAVANIFKNVVDQALVNNAIRRGAAGSGVTSGWLGQERIKAGEEELGQRKGIENERNELLNAINAQVLGKEQETTDALGLLEGLRGKQTDVSYADLERLARGDFLQEKQGTFENELQNAIFQGGYSTDQANFLLNKFNSESSASLGQAELALRARETALNEALGQYNMTPNRGYGATDVSAYETARTSLLDAQTQQILATLKGGGSELDKLMEAFMIKQLQALQ